MKRTVLVAALGLDLVGAVGALLAALPSWQTVTTPRSKPFHDDVLGLTGRTVDSAPTAFALVALAGVVAMLATRGIARRLVGAVLVLAGAGLAWRAVVSSGAVGTYRARVLVAAHHRTVDTSGVVPRVDSDSAWPWLTVACAALIVIPGVLAVACGHRWPSLSSRYERPDGTAESTERSGEPDVRSGDEVAQRERARTAATLWNALDCGDDPTR